MFLCVFVCARAAVGLWPWDESFTAAPIDTSAAFSSMMLRALQADGTKPSPHIAISMYAFLLMKRMQRSRHFRQHRMQFTAKRTRHDRSISCLYLWSRYSKIARTSWTSATMSDPKAIEPKW